MPKDIEFLEDFNKKYDALCQCDVIVDKKQQSNYKIGKFISQKRRHAQINIIGPKHAFVLELYYKKFRNGFFITPNIRYISIKDLEKMTISYNTIEISADQLVQLAIRIILEMEDSLVTIARTLLKIIFLPWE